MVGDAEKEFELEGEAGLEIHLRCQSEVPVFISSALRKSVSKIPFCSIGSVTVPERIAEILRRAERALDREGLGEVAPSSKLVLRFAAEVPTSSTGPRFRHLALVFRRTADGTAWIRIGELHEVWQL